MKKYRFLLTEESGYSKNAIKIYSKLGKVFNNNNYINNIDEINVLVVKLNFNLNVNYLNKFKNLEFILTSTTGTTHIDIDYCKKKLIKIIKLESNDKELNKVTSTAELTIGMILVIVRNLHTAYFDFVKKKKNSRNHYIGRSLSNLSIGIIGYGRIGKMVSKMAKVFKMDVFIYEIDKKKIPLNSKLKFVTSMKEIFIKSDIISIHIPYIYKNQHIINKKLFALTKNKPYLINTSRGELINDEDLFWALKNQKLSGAALDVLSDEYNCESLFYKKLNKNSQYNFFILPHLGGCTLDSMQITEDIIAKKFERIAK